MQEDRQLLERFAENRSEAAFGELVNRYINLVYSTALRRTNFDFHLAQDGDQLTQQADQIEALLPQVSEQDWIIYRDRWLTLGEQNAVVWLINKYGQNSTATNP